MLKSLAIETFRTDLEIYDRLGPAKEAGFDYIHLDDWTPLDFTRLKENMVRHGIRISQINGDGNHLASIPEKSREFLEFLSQSLAVAKSLACPGLLVRVGDRRGASGSLVDAVSRARRSNRTLMLEPDVDYDNTADFEKIIALVGDMVGVADNCSLRLCLKFRRQKMNWHSLAALTRKYVSVVGNVAIEDEPGMPSAEAQGSNQAFRRVLADELCYHAFVSFRLHPENPVEESLKSISSVWGYASATLNFGK